MNLLERIRSQRAEKRKKQPFQPTLYARISGLVRAHGLGEAFLQRLEVGADPVSEDDQALEKERWKEPYQPPLFALSTEEQYRLTMAIISTAGNPYLDFVSSPEELLLCGPLFRRNPSLRPDLLSRYHFETLLHVEVAKERIRGLSDEVELLLGRGNLGGDEQLRLSVLQERVTGLRRFVARVETREAR